MTESIYSLPVMDTVKAAWAKVKGAKGTFWAVIGSMLLAMFILGACSGGAKAADMAGLSGLFHFLGAVVQMLITWSLIYMGIQRALDSPIRFGMISYSLDLAIILYMIGFYILRFLVILPAGIVIGIGFACSNMSDSTILHLLGFLLSLVGMIAVIYLSIRMWLGQGLILDKKINSWQALKISFKATRCNVWSLVGITLVNVLIIIGCVITFGIGLIWALPYFFIMYGEVYKNLYSSRQDALSAN